ncbi:protein Flattop isoform X2 [Antechinus flavipes]|uniref:protein Flattop isoform X2 n=1 Tax=Antechinus flavipes TaxID=38775 RepID=UPI0022361F08|nr:protein Flattop isoform X2 [Antechinus flavipes]
MASNYTANQFENAFDANYLRNWCIAKGSKKQPEAHEGYTQIIANDRGHLLPSVPRSKANPWGTFMGTWQMPLQIPPARINLTARSTAAANRLLNWPQDSGPRGNRNTPKLQEKTATPKAVQETPPPSPAANSPAAQSPAPNSPAANSPAPTSSPSRSLPNASPPPHPPPNQICSCYCTCCCCRPAKIAPKRSSTSEVYSSSNEPEDQEIQERNIENEEAQQEKGAPAPLSPKKITE